MTELLPWQQDWWKALGPAGPRLPHALLFYGQAGTGKVAFARLFGQALLCQSPGPTGLPCGTCDACAWVIAGNHPDYRLIRPEAVELAEGAAEVDSEEGDGSAPATESSTDEPAGRSKRQPSKEIRIQQVRQLADSLMISSHRGGRRVVVVYPAQAMNVFTANAFLKMLEEPPENTVFLLVTDALDGLLPTILSRCRKVPLAAPDSSVALEWLEGQGVAQASQWLAEEGGAPLAALRASQEAATTGPAREALFAVLARPELAASMAAAERLSKCDPRLVVGWIQRWMYDCMGYRAAQRIRYYPSHKSTIADLSETLDVVRCMSYVRSLAAERRVVDHPLNARLFVESLLLGYCRALRRG